MADTDLRAESVLHNHPFSSPPPAAVMRVLSRFDRPRLEAFVAVAIDLLDTFDGDADLEPNGDDEPTGDEQDAAYVEWSCRPHRQRAKPNLMLGQEDDEQDDWDEDSHDREAIDEREERDDEDACDVPPMWPGEADPFASN